MSTTEQKKEAPAAAAPAAEAAPAEPKAAPAEPAPKEEAKPQEKEEPKAKKAAKKPKKAPAAKPMTEEQKAKKRENEKAREEELVAAMCEIDWRDLTFVGTEIPSMAEMRRAKFMFPDLTAELLEGELSDRSRTVYLWMTSEHFITSIRPMTKYPEMAPALREAWSRLFMTTQLCLFLDF
eukprot:m51a1_g1267 hypothetical protein (180) ;mRNA; r:80336-91120